MKRIVFTFIIFFFLQFASGQNTRETRLNKDFIIGAFKDAKALALSPLQWERNDVFLASAIAGTGFLVFTQDDRLQDFFQKNRTPFSNAVSKYGLDPIGGGIYTIPLVSGFYIYGILSKKNRYERFALNTGKALAINTFITYSVKYLAQRQRPHEGGVPDKFKWHGPFSGSGSTSFFSGHTMLVFTLATAFAHEFNDKPWVAYTAYSLAGLVGISRLHDNKHWASDVFIAAAFAYFSTKFLMRRNDKIALYTHSDIVNGFQFNSVGLRFNLP